MKPEAGAMRTIVGVLVAVCVGCGDQQSPTAPSVASNPEQPTAQYSLSGIVQDTAFRAVADVRIDVVEGQRAGVSVVTDARGRYELPGSFSSTILVRASKDGYVPVARRHDPSTWRQEQQQLGFTLELSSASVNLTGNYALTLTADTACTALPADLRTRKYAASIAPRQNASIPHQYDAALDGGRFLSSPFHISVAGRSAYFYLGDPYDWIDAIVEELTPSTYLAIWGFGELPIGESSIAGTLAYGAFEYCVSPTSPVSNGWYRCPEAVKCPMQRLQLDRQ